MLLGRPRCDLPVDLPVVGESGSVFGCRAEWVEDLGLVLQAVSSSHPLLSVIRIGHILVFTSVPPFLSNEVLLSDLNLSIRAFVALDLSNGVLHIGPHILQFFVGCGLEDFVMGD